jgi:N,N-dimethylformamidase beta subunit-like, C-terminal
MVEPPSPVPGVTLEGYADRVTVAAGEQIRFMLAGSPGEARFSIVRPVHGDPNPAGPGVKLERVPWGSESTVAVSPRRVDFGSFVEVPHAEALAPRGSFTLVLWHFPTLLTGAWQALAAKWAPGQLSYALFTVGHHLLVAAVSHDGVRAAMCGGVEFMAPRRWQVAALTYEAEEGLLGVYQLGSEPSGRSLATGAEGVIATKSVRPGPVNAGAAPLLFGACALPEGKGHWAHFNGKIASPVLLDRALKPGELLELVLGRATDELEHALGRWDFSRAVRTTRVVDRSTHQNHGVAVNAPARAVPGPRWSGTSASLYTHDPDLYDAVHLHDDDLDDARWPPTVEVEIPADASSRIYLARVERDVDALALPFVVRPDRPRADLCMLVPTLTWQAYSSNRAPHSFTEDGLVDRALCLYDVHSDGSMVYYVTARKPTRSGNPSEGFRLWGAHTLAANLYLVDWLETKAFDYEAVADHDLHERGAELLAPYRCVVVGSHPEYWTDAMLGALRAWLEAGGRLLYLGGNGFYWVTSVDQERPYLMEVRKSGDGDYEDWWAPPAPGEMMHSTTLEPGGLWARRGRSPRDLTGIEHSANVFVQGEGRWGFRRLPASFGPAYDFVFDGIDAEVIGDFGLNLGSAAGYEMDAAQDWLSVQGPQPIVLARASHPAFEPTMRMPMAPACDLALSTHPSGGAVFAAGSVTWTGSLSWNGYDNSVSRVTANVLRRFLETPAGKSVLSGQNPAA